MNKDLGIVCIGSLHQQTWTKTFRMEKNVCKIYLLSTSDLSLWSSQHQSLSFHPYTLSPCLLINDGIGAFLAHKPHIFLSLYKNMQFSQILPLSG